MHKENKDYRGWVAVRDGAETEIQVWEPGLGGAPRVPPFRKFKQLLGTYISPFLWACKNEKAAPSQTSLPMSFPISNWIVEAKWPLGAGTCIPSFEEINTLDLKEVVLQKQFPNSKHRKKLQPRRIMPFHKCGDILEMQVSKKNGRLILNIC